MVFVLSRLVVAAMKAEFLSLGMYQPVKEDRRLAAV